MDAPQADALNVFISYRRADSAGHAGRIQDALRRQFGEDHVFFDVTTIEAGMDFAVAIRRAIDRSAVVVVVIGPRWGRRRFLDRIRSRADWARFEIEYAMRAGKPIIPVLVGGAAMPTSLPGSLQSLSTVHAISLRDDSWEDDVERLTGRLPDVAREPVAALVPAAVPGWTRKAIIAGAVALALLSVWAGPRLWAMLTSAGNQPPSSPLASKGRADGQASQPGSRDGATAANQLPTEGTIDVNVFNRIGIVSATRFTLTAKGVSDRDGDELRYRWDFGDGSPSPPSAPSVTRVFERVRSYDVVLYVNDGKMKEDLAVARTKVTVRSLTGTWLLSLQPDPKAGYRVPESYTVELIQEGDQLSGRITPAGSSRSTVITGQVEDPMNVSFGSEHAWWNDDSDAYFDLAVSDGALMIQMTNRTPGRCSWQVPCLGARMTKQ